MSLTLAARRLVTRPLRRTLVGSIIVFVAHNQLGRLRLLAGDIEADSGMAHAGLAIEDSLAYIDLVFREYKEQSGVDHFQGRAAEVGPGDSCATGLMLLADGCGHVDLVDRFYSMRDKSHHAAIYRALISRSERLRELFGQAEDEEQFAGIRRHYGDAASAEQFFIANRGYDVIVSRAVLEHVRDPAISLKAMAAALKKGGVMMHVVDLRDHGMFSSVGFPETKFLELPDSIYRMMTDAVGRPNRIPLGAYRRALADTELDAEIKVTSIVGQPMLSVPTPYDDIGKVQREAGLAAIRSIRSRLAVSLKDESDEDLSVSSFFLTARH